MPAVTARGPRVRLHQGNCTDAVPNSDQEPGTLRGSQRADGITGTFWEYS